MPVFCFLDESSLDLSSNQSLLPGIGSSSTPSLSEMPVISEESSLPASRSPLTNAEAKEIAEAHENRSKLGEDQDDYKARLKTKLGRGKNNSTEEEITRIVGFAVARYFKQERKSAAASSTSSSSSGAGTRGMHSDSSSSSSHSPVSYSSLINTYSNTLKGAVVLVEENCVVVIEHYQLKHNPDLAILHAGGPWIGKKGSTLKGGWDAHVKNFAPAILAHVKPLIAGMDITKPLVLKKVRLDEIDAYISVVFDGGFYFISYHGNPPD